MAGLRPLAWLRWDLRDAGAHGKHELIPVTVLELLEFTSPDVKVA